MVDPGVYQVLEQLLIAVISGYRSQWCEVEGDLLHLGHLLEPVRLAK